MRHRSLFAQLKSGGAQRTRRGRSVACAAVLAVVFSVFTVWLGGVAQACPSGRAHDDRAAAQVHKVEPAPRVVTTSASSLSKTDIQRDGTTCCGGAFHPKTTGCSSGCCIACSAALPATTSNLAPDGASQRFALPQQVGLRIADPDPHLRPPCLSA